MAHESILPELPQLVSRRWSSAVRDIIGRYREWAHRRKVYNSTFRELARCSDRDLADISIARYDIPRIAAEAARTASGEQSR